MLFLLKEQCNKKTHVASFLNCRFVSIYSSNSRSLSGIEDCVFHIHTYLIFRDFSDIDSSELRIKSLQSLCEEVLSHGICISLSYYRFQSCLYIFQQDDIHMFCLYKHSLPDYLSKKYESPFNFLWRSMRFNKPFKNSLCFQTVSYSPHF